MRRFVLQRLALFLNLFESRCGSQHLHLAYRNFVESLESISLRHPHVNQLGIHAFNIGQHEQLFNCGVITHVPTKVRVAISPLFGGLAKQSNIQNICFVSVGSGRLSGRKCGGN